jgi:hypothetical protein
VHGSVHDVPSPTSTSNGELEYFASEAVESVQLGSGLVADDGGRSERLQPDRQARTPRPRNTGELIRLGRDSLKNASVHQMRELVSADAVVGELAVSHNTVLLSSPFGKPVMRCSC